MNRHDPDTVYRAAVIGAGSAGLTLAIGLAGFGHQIALIEAGPIGGDCTNVGCIPSKTLLYAARTATPDPLGHARTKRDELSDREEAEMLDHESISLVRGRGRVTGRNGADDASRAPHVVEVEADDGTITAVRAENVAICTGSRPVMIAIDGLDAERVLTNENLFDLTEVPAHIVLVGGGAISLEMATAFLDLGSVVDIVELEPRLIANEDPLVSATIHAALAERGARIHTSTSIERFDDTTAHLGDGTTITDVDKVLLAIGRHPVVDDLGLDAAGVTRTKRGIVADSFGRTEVEGIYAVGDVTGNTVTTHGANAIGRRAIRAIALPYLPRVGGPRALPNAVYSRPEIASVGMSIDELERYPARARRRHQVRIAELDRGFTDDVEHGVAIVDVERFTGNVLRAAIVGPSAAEIIGIFTTAIDQGIGLRKMFGTVMPYPSYSQLVGHLVDEFAQVTYRSLPREWIAMIGGRVVRVLSRR